MNEKKLIHTKKSVNLSYYKFDFVRITLYCSPTHLIYDPILNFKKYIGRT